MDKTHLSILHLPSWSWLKKIKLASLFSLRGRRAWNTVFVKSLQMDEKGRILYDIQPFTN
ncbi:MAG: hypothetical protein VX254_02875 [Planctomycetota bacterium]|nr:hypothetical protein [Planctomycetota bacterium]